MEKKILEEKLYSLVSILKPTQLAIEEGAKSDKQIIEEILGDVASEISKAREEGKREALGQIQRFVEDEMLVITRDGTDILEKYIKEWLSKLTTK